MGVRAEKKAATRRAIAVALRDLVLANGYAETTVDAVAERAGISKATFFRYFPSKEAAFFADQRAHLQAFSTALRQPQPGATPLFRVKNACLGVAAAYMHERQHRLSMHHITTTTPALSNHDAQLDADWEAEIAATLAEQFAGPDARVAAGAIIGVMRAVVRDWYASECTDDLVAAGDNAFTLLAGGLDSRGAR